jgi:hypothetical protein
MTQRNKVHIDQESYVLLQLEATLQGESLKAALSRLVKAGVSKKTLAALQAAQSTHENKVPKGTIEQSPQGNPIEVPKGTIEQSPNGPKSPLDTLPPSSELLSAKEKTALEYLKAGVPLREIERLEKGKTGLTKAIVSGMTQKFIGMGLYEGGKRGPKKQKLK